MLHVANDAEPKLLWIIILLVAQLPQAHARRLKLTPQVSHPEVRLSDFGVEMRNDVQDAEVYRTAIVAKLKEVMEAAEKAFSPDAAEDDCTDENCCIISRTSLLVRESDGSWKVGSWGLAAIVAPPGRTSDEAYARINLYRLTSLREWYCKKFSDPMTGAKITATSSVQVLKLNDIETPLCNLSQPTGARAPWQIEENQALHEAAKNCQADLVSTILQNMNDATVMAQDSRGRTALHPAASMGCFDVVVLLLQRMTNTAVGLADEHMWTALHEAVAGGRANHLLIRELVARMDDADLIATPSYSFQYNHFTALHMAANCYRGTSERAAVVREILERMPSAATVTNSQGQTALHCVADPRPPRQFSSQSIRETALAIVDKMDEEAVCMQDSLGWTALHRAARFGESVFVQALLTTSQGRATLNLVDLGGSTPLLSAVNYGEVETVRAIIPHLQSAAFAVRNNDGQTALHLAAILRGARGNNLEQAQVSLIRELVARMDHPSIIAQDTAGKTALHHACSAGLIRQGFARSVGSATAVSAILDAMTNAEVGLQDFQQRTALHWAAKSGLSDAIPALLRKMDRGTVELQDADGATALHLAAEEGHVAVLDQLLPSWVCVSQEDGEGLTALKRARKAGQIQATLRLTAAKVKRFFG